MTFAAPAAAGTSASFSAPGTYVLQTDRVRRSVTTVIDSAAGDRQDG